MSSLARRMRWLLSLLWLLSGTAGAQVTAPQPPQTQLPAATLPPAHEATEKTGIARWFDPATAPFIPVPEIAVDPDSGTTLGLIPTWVHTDEHRSVDRIVAPDIIHNPYFGYGMHARVYDYPSTDEQWSIVAGIKERVEREFDAEYQRGRLREHRWSFNGSLVYDRDGTPRFFGLGNNSPAIAETNYTNSQKRAQAQIGLNLTHDWQLQYTARFQDVEVLPGTLAHIASIETRFARLLGLGKDDERLNRLAVIYDTRDDLTVPSRGSMWILYGGVASSTGFFNESLFSEAGIDGRTFWPMSDDVILASHMALRYLPTTHRVPFWALSSLGGGESEIGGVQPLRGYGTGRFYDRDAFSASFELRTRITSLDVVATRLDLEVAPFVDLGRVFSRTSTFPLQHLHTVGGVGFRGIARPFVVGFVDIGYGTEGVAVFTGINYPF